MPHAQAALPSSSRIRARAARKASLGLLESGFKVTACSQHVDHLEQGLLDIVTGQRGDLPLAEQAAPESVAR